MSIAASGGSVEYAAARQRMWTKFGFRGVELRVDAMLGEEFFGVEMFPEHYDRPIYQKSLQKLETRSSMSLGIEIPERVRVVWRAIDKPKSGKYGEMTYEGRLTGDYTIDVGARIPQAVIDDLRRERGQLRLKFRLHRDGVFFGWDIERRPGYDPKAKDERGAPIYFPPEHSMAGGDFREADIYNGQAVRNGWYIDPKTKQKIETAF